MMSRDTPRFSWLQEKDIGRLACLVRHEILARRPRNFGLKGVRGGVGFGFANVPNYLDNTTFNRLVESGLIGTAGTPTQLLYQQIVRSFNGQKSLVVATLHGEEVPQSKKNTQKRKMRNSS
jgi:hypothetical protein